MFPGQLEIKPGGVRDKDGRHKQTERDGGRERDGEMDEEREMEMERWTKRERWRWRKRDRNEVERKVRPVYSTKLLMGTKAFAISVHVTM